MAADTRITTGVDDAGHTATAAATAGSPGSTAGPGDTGDDGATGGGEVNGAVAVAGADRVPADAHARQLAGLDALELGGESSGGPAARVWGRLWPMALAVAIVLAVWQSVVWAGFWPEYVFAGPADVAPVLFDRLTSGDYWEAIGVTMRRAVTGFAVSVAVGLVVGALVSRVRVLRAAFGSLITGLQTMPSIAWFPLAILLFGLTESAITFVVILGATPSIANGLITGVDYTPPILLRAGHVLGFRRLQLYRHVILPASLPSFLAGLKQGWAFAWRSLMAGELVVIIAHQSSLGERLFFDRELADSAGLLSTMIVILVIGIGVDLLFETADTSLRRRWGLARTSA
ncbi:ABC transporter permease [Streptosporangium sp. NPDC048047]|uniref:ABC transporter permease n=1 Tax=Streptosporangium sp. NPDC048047 TaxID=3155748 RepID=UPI00344663C7